MMNACPYFFVVFLFIFGVADAAKTIANKIIDEERFVVFNSRSLTGECVAVCESTVEPTVPPTFAEVVAATEPPTVSPSNVPSQAPTDVPSAGPSESSMPTDCYDKYDIHSDQVLHQAGYDLPLPSDGVEIVKADDEKSVTIQINQLWIEDASITIFIHYHSAVQESSVCEAGESLSYEDSFTKELTCYDGWTDVGLFVYFEEELTIEDCNGCMPPEQNQENVIAYYFEVPCRPICSGDDEGKEGGVEHKQMPHENTRRVLKDGDIFSAENEVPLIVWEAPQDSPLSNDTLDESSDMQSNFRPETIDMNQQEDAMAFLYGSSKSVTNEQETQAWLRGVAQS